MKTTRLSVAIGSTFLTLCLAASASAAERLRIGIEAAYPPFASKSADGQIVGFDHDIGEALCARMQVECQWVEQEFDGLIPSLKVRKVDAVLSSLTVTEERRRSVDFTAPYYRTAGRVVMREGSDPGQDLAGLAGKRVAVQRSSIHDRYATEVLAPRGVEVVRYASLNESYLDLLAGRVDAVQADDVALQLGFLDTPNGKGYAFVGEPLRDSRYYGDGVAIAVRKGDQALAGRFNQALAAIRQDGEYQRIQDRYFKFDIYGD